MLSGSDDKTIKLWDATTGALIRTFEGYPVAFSPDGARILSDSRDNTIKLWDAATGALIRSFAGASFPVAFSPDGTRLLSGGDGTIRIWSVATGELLATFIGSEEGEWLAITPAGFFAGSRIGAGKLVSVVRGLQSYSLLQFYDDLYRPDLVEQRLKGDLLGQYKDAAAKINLEKILDSAP